MENVYATPEADLRRATTGERTGGNIEDAIAGNIEVGMLETLGEAWRKLKGFKLTCHVAILVYFLIAVLAVVVSFAIEWSISQIGIDPVAVVILGTLLQMVVGVVSYPVFVGIHILGMRHAEDRSIATGMTLRYFNKIPVLLGCYLLMMIMILIGLVLLVIPGIYLMFAYMYAMPLIVEKNMSAWQALEVSRKAITKVWFRFVGLIFLIGIINLLAMIPLGIPMIWTIPWAVLAMAMVYTKLFGAEAQTLAD